jgi:hypothetical protein
MLVRERAAIAGMVAVTLGFASAPALGQESSSSLTRVLWTGPSSGVPSNAKRAALTSLYVLSAASLVGTGYFAYRWAGANEDVGSRSEQGVCFELATRDCHEFMDAQADVRGARRYTAASAAATAGFLLSGVLVAQYWDNSAVGFNVSPGVVAVQFVANF